MLYLSGMAKKRPKLAGETLTVKEYEMAKKSFQELVEKKYGIDRDVQIAKKLKDMPESCRKTYKKAVTHRSMRAAVNSQCLECVGYVRKEISVCTDLGCPLYSYRPFQKRISGQDTPSDFAEDGLRGLLCAIEWTNGL